jgi:hypothetical protein
MVGDIEIKGKIRKITNNHLLEGRFGIVDLNGNNDSHKNHYVMELIGKRHGIFTQSM